MFRSNRRTVHVMAVLVTAIHVFPRGKDVDARDKPAHDGVPAIELNMRSFSATVHLTDDGKAAADGPDHSVIYSPPCSMSATPR